MRHPSASCPRCGSERQGSLRFCPNCGFDYGAASPADATEERATLAAGPEGAGSAAIDQPQRRRWLRWAVIGILALLFIGFIGTLTADEQTGSGQTSPTPDSTASETAEPTAIATSEPTAAPTPTTAPTPTPEPTPAFAAIELSGIGNAVPRFDIPEGSAAIAQIAHGGASNFAVWTVDASGSQTDLLVNTIGTYSGTVLFDEQDGSHTDAFDIEADGRWTVTIRPVTEAFHWDGTETLTGAGDDVVILDPASSGLKSTTLTHAGDGNFAVWLFSPSGRDLAVNEIGQFSGEVLIADGTFLMEVTATGQWTSSPPQ
jgi:hypothetical protein